MLIRLLYAFIGCLLIAGCTKHEPKYAIAEQIKTIDESRLKHHVQTLTSYGPRSFKDIRATRQAVAYIKSQLVELGYQPIEEPVGKTVTNQGSRYSFINILAEHRGFSNPAQVLEVGAHYDTVENTRGADDNASGVAALLEIARLISGVRTTRTIRLCFFALEESGRDGSYAHVKQIQARNERLEGAIIFEMVGYATDQPDSQRTPARIPLLFSPPSVGNFVAVVGNINSGGLGNRFEAAARSYVPGLAYFSANRLGGFFKDALRSDHKAYWDAGFRALMLTDTANFRNPHYHQSSDTPETLNYHFLRHVTQATAATVLE